MTSPWYYFSNIGVRPGHDFVELKRIRLLNQLCMVLIPFLAIFLVRDSIEGDINGVLLSLAVGGIILLTPVLQRFQYYRLARWVFVVLMIFSVTGLIMLYGRDLGGEFICMVSVLVVLILFNQIWDQVLLFAMVFGSYIFSQIYLSYNEAVFAADLSPFTKELLFLTSIACLMLLTMVFIQENLFFELQSRELLKSLREKNDVLRQKQLEIEQQNEKLAQANRELEKFAYIASHDLKTPLRSINGFLMLIERRLEKRGLMDAEIQEFFDFATGGARQMYLLIDDILAYSQLNKNDTSLTTVDLNEVMKKVEHNLRGVIQEKHASIVQDPLPCIVGNAAHLLLLFQNLIENGIKYNKSEQPLIQVRFEQFSDHFVLSVADNGIGIGTLYQEKIFDMFTRLHSAVNYSGSGIGLAICKKIVQGCEGRIRLESREGGGTTFFIEFPDHLLIARETKSLGSP